MSPPTKVLHYKSKKQNFQDFMLASQIVCFLLPYFTHLSQLLMFHFQVNSRGSKITKSLKKHDLCDSISSFFFSGKRLIGQIKEKIVFP